MQNKAGNGKSKDTKPICVCDSSEGKGWGGETKGSSQRCVCMCVCVCACVCIEVEREGGGREMPVLRKMKAAVMTATIKKMLRLHRRKAEGWGCIPF